MDRIGIRELKEHASELFRRVREDGMRFEVTYHGEVIAHVVPVRALAAAESPTELEEHWDRLAEEVNASWPAGVTAVEAVREGRREL